MSETPLEMKYVWQKKDKYYYDVVQYMEFKFALKEVETIIV